MRISAGMALMKPTSFLFEDTLTPQCHCGNQPGGRRALRGEDMFSGRADKISGIMLLYKIGNEDSVEVPAPLNSNKRLSALSTL